MNCVECGALITNNSGTNENPLCGTCYNRMLKEYAPQSGTENKPGNKLNDSLVCKQCSGTMKKAVKIKSSIGIQIVGLILFIVGILLLFVFPIGTLLGIALMIVAAKMGYNKIKVWKCNNCGYFYERD
jgi:hypothetical protein